MSEKKKEKEVKEELPYWDIVYEQQMWDDYLAWCKEQENSTHE